MVPPLLWGLTSADPVPVLPRPGTGPTPDLCAACPCRSEFSVGGFGRFVGRKAGAVANPLDQSVLKALLRGGLGP